MSDQSTSQTTGPRHQMSVEAALAQNAKTGGSRTIEYGGMMVTAPVRDIRRAIEALHAGDRLKIMASVNAALARTFPRVKAGKASLKQAIKCGQDIAIWFANEIIEGRATLEVQ